MEKAAIFYGYIFCLKNEKEYVILRLTNVRQIRREPMGSDGTRERIMETALEMFSQKGYAAVSMRDISGVVGIRASSLYYHFKSNESIMRCK